MQTPKLESVICERPYYLKLKYKDGKNFLFDVKPYIQGSWFGHLADWDYFIKVKITADEYGVEWPDGQDIAPHELYENGEYIYQSTYSFEEIESAFANESVYENIKNALSEIIDTEA